MLESGLNQHELSRQTGVSQPRISQVLNGLGYFSGRAATRIRQALRNKVDWEDLVRIPQPQAARRRRRRAAQ